MASFSNQFLQGLINPNYQQGLLTASTRVGSFFDRQKEAEKIKQLTSFPSIAGAGAGAAVNGDANASTPLSYDYEGILNRIDQVTALSTQYASRGDRARALAYKNVADTLTTSLKSQGINAITSLLQEMETSTDIDYIKDLQTQILNIATNTRQPSPTQFVGEATKRIKQLDDARIKASEETVLALSNSIASNLSISNISTHVNNMPDLTDLEKNKLIRDATSLRKIINDSAKMLEDSKIPPGHLKYLKSNPNLLNDPAVQAAMDVFERRNDPNQTVNPNELARAAGVIRKIVEQEYGRQQEVNRSKDRLEAQAEKMVERLLEEDSISEWYYGEDLLELTRRVSNDDDMSEVFYSIVAQEIEKNPNVDPQAAVYTAINILGEERELDLRLEEGRQLNKAEKAAIAAEREDAIVFLMQEENLSREEATVKLKQREEEEIMQYIGAQSALPPYGQNL